MDNTGEKALRKLKVGCVLILVFCLSACREKTTDLKNATTELASDNGYICTSYEEIKWDNDTKMILSCYGNLVYSVETQFYYESQRIREEEIEEIVEDYDQLEIKSVIYAQTLEGKGLSNETRIGETDGIVKGAALCDENVVLSMEDVKTYLGLKDGFFITKLDKDGREIYRTEMESGYAPSTLKIDEHKNLYALKQNIMYCFNPKGRCEKKINFETQGIDFCPDRNGGFYMTRMGITAPIELIRYKDGKEEPVKMEQTGLYRFIQVASGDIIVCDNKTAYLYNEEVDAWEVFLSFTDLDIYLTEVAECWFDDEGLLRMLIREDGGKEMYLSTSRKRLEGENKETLTLGVWDLSEELLRLVSKFNRINERFRVEVIDYSKMKLNQEDGLDKEKTIDRIQLELLAGNGPDILCSDLIDFKSLAENGLIENLTPYLNDSVNISKADFFEEILKSATYDDKLAYIPLSFKIRTIAGKHTILENSDTWNLTGFFDFVKVHPDSFVLMPRQWQIDNGAEDLLRIGLIMNQDNTFKDQSFDNVTEKDVLIEMLNQSRKIFIASELSPSEMQAAYRDEKVLLYELTIDDFWDIYDCEIEKFGKGQMKLIGYPTNLDASGSMMIPGKGYGIYSLCKHKEEAWHFLEFLVTYETKTETLSIFSPLKKYFDKQMAYARNCIKEEASTEETEFLENDLRVLQKLVLNSVGTYCCTDEFIMQIVFEEAQSYYKSENKTADQVADIILNRVKLYIRENAR